MTRLRVEIVLAVLFVSLAALTLIWPDWIETFGFDPDHGDGSVERLIAAGFGVVAVIAAVLAHYDFRKARPAGG